MFSTLTLWATAFVEQYGYLGIFLLTYTEHFIQPILPDPFIIGATALGLNIDLTILIVSIAAVLGSLTGYFLGKFLGKPAIKKLFGEKIIHKGEKFFDKYGAWGIIIAGLTPIPYKVATWLAGMSNMPLGKFIIASIVGRIPRFVAMAYFGDVIRRMWS